MTRGPQNPTRTVIPAARYGARLEAAQSAAATEGLSGLLIGVGPDLRYLAGYNFEAKTHYGLLDPSQWQGLSGYDFYVESSKLVQGGATVAGESMQLRGTPEQIVEKIRYLQERTSMRELACIFQYGGMPHALAEKSMRLFAQEVLLAVHEMDAPLHASAVGDAAAVQA